MKVGLFSGRPSAASRTGGGALSDTEGVARSCFSGGGPIFEMTLCPALGIRQGNCSLRTGTFRLRTGTLWPFWFASGYCCNAVLMAKKKNPAAVELGRKGGKASAEKLTDEQRKEKARKAAQARWTKRQK